MKKKKSRKVSATAGRIAELKEKIEVQRRRAMRPTLPVNAQTRVSESLVERKRRAEKKRIKRADWDEL